MRKLHDSALRQRIYSLKIINPGNKDKINIEAELFSLDGKERFYLKSSKDLNLASQLGKEVGEILKKQSNNSYKK